MHKYKALLIHADPLIRHELRKLLSGVEEIRILGEAVSSFEAMELLEAIPYDVFFIGIDLPGGVSGIELGQMLTQRKSKPALVFVASDESLAFKGFELAALDYLLWPCSTERLQMTVARLNQRKPRERLDVQPRGWGGGGTENEEETLQLNLGDEEEETFLKALSNAWESSRSRPPEIEKLVINQDGRMILVPYTQIVFVEAYEDYSYVHTSSQKFLTSYRLKNLEDRLTAAPVLQGPPQVSRQSGHGHGNSVSARIEFHAPHGREEAYRVADQQAENFRAEGYSWALRFHSTRTFHL
jgi:DNA-binding LytR/AlgR family response regulator